MSHDLSHIFDAIRRTRNSWYAVSVALFAVAIPMTIGPQLSTESAPIQWTASAIGLLTLGCTAGIFYMAWQMRDPAQAPLAVVLLKRPRDVSWVYLQQTQSAAGGLILRKSHSVKVCTIAKKTLTLQVSGRHLDAVMTALSARLPHATFGYDKETQRRYKADPCSLLSATI